jgi:serine/threonine protein kinase
MVLSVAIKIFTSASPEEYYTCMSRCIPVMRAISKHPNYLELVNAFDDGFARRSAIFPMMSRSLENLYENTGIIHVAVLKQFLEKIVIAGIDHLHKSKIAHLDMKCGNVLMTSDNMCKICDLGLAARFSENDVVVFKATHPFVAPEV